MGRETFLHLVCLECLGLKAAAVYQREAENPPCAGAVLRLHKVLGFQPLQLIVQFCYWGKKGATMGTVWSPFLW